MHSWPSVVVNVKVARATHDALLHIPFRHPLATFATYVFIAVIEWFMWRGVNDSRRYRSLQSMIWIAGLLALLHQAQSTWKLSRMPNAKKGGVTMTCTNT